VSIDLVTTAEVENAWAGFSALATDEKTALIDVVSSAIAQHAGREFQSTTYTEYHDGKNRPRLWLRHTPVISITSVSINGTALDNTDGTAWTIDLESGELLYGTGDNGDPAFNPWFPIGKKNIVVVYAAGYAAIPADVKRAAILWMQAISGQHQAGGGAYKSESLGDYSYTLADPSLQEMPPLVRMLLKPYATPDPIC
jgi:hypothetical protein